jgi:hypothetical protein
VNAKQCRGKPELIQIILQKVESFQEVSGSTEIGLDLHSGHAAILAQKQREKAPATAEAQSFLPAAEAADYLAAAAATALSDLAYLRRKRSTRPAVSTKRCLPVKNGWQTEQIST